MFFRTVFEQCSGKCKERLDNGGYCEADGNVACKSERCLCGFCQAAVEETPDYHGDNKVPISGKCDNHNNCESGYCHGIVRLKTCSGTCQEQLDNGGECLQGGNARCKSGRCHCDYCRAVIEKTPDYHGDNKTPLFGKCTEHKNCESGYCHGIVRPGLLVTACSGTCGEQIDNDGECFEGGNARCKSGRCFCGRCRAALTPSAGHRGDNKVPDNGVCKIYYNCESGYCHGAAFPWVECKGRCEPKKDDGGDCFQIGSIRCKSNRCVCGQCAAQKTPTPQDPVGDRKVLTGRNCDKHENCQYGFCFKTDPKISCSGKCNSWLKDGVACGDNNDICESGVCFCGECVVQGNVPENRPCTDHSNCASKWCNNEDGGRCQGNCTSRLENGADCSRWGRIQCKSGHSVCDFCRTPGRRQVPSNGPCSNDLDCASGSCISLTDDECSGRCAGGTGDGRTCGQPRDCESERCVCTTCRSHDYLIPDGGACDKDTDCYSGNCLGSSGNNCDGKCQPLQPHCPGNTGPGSSETGGSGISGGSGPTGQPGRPDVPGDSGNEISDGNDDSQTCEDGKELACVGE